MTARPARHYPGRHHLLTRHPKGFPMNRFAQFVLSSALLLVAAAPSRAETTVNIYSYRQPELIEPLLQAVTAKTGIRTRLVFADAGLVERMAQEGANSPADLLLTTDLTRLVQATDEGLAQPVADASILQHVPANLRDSENRWFGLTMRARVAYVSKERVTQAALSYEELATPAWKGRICIRPGQHVYNLGLISAMIEHRGEDATREWLKGLKANLAVKPSGNDRSQAKSVYAGECDLAIGNTYYMGKMMTNTQEPEQQEWAKAVRLIFPSSDAMPTHVNISGMMLAKNAPNREAALQLMAYLASPSAQQIYAQANFEYPVSPDVAPDSLVAAWGKLTPDPSPVQNLAKHMKRASELVDEVRFDE